MERNYYGWNSRSDSYYSQEGFFRGGMHRANLPRNNLGYEQSDPFREDGFYPQDQSRRFHESNYSRRARGSHQNVGGGTSRAKHPKGLKGKEIGLWYASQQRKKPKKDHTPLLSMDEEEAKAINKAIDGLNSCKVECFSHSVQESEMASTSAAIKEEFDGVSSCKVECFSHSVQESEMASTSAVIKEESQSNLWDLDYDGINTEVSDVQIKTERQEGGLNQLLNKIGESDFKNAYKANIEGNKLRDEGFNSHGNQLSKLVKVEHVDQQLIDDFMEKQQNRKYKEMLTIRQKLPAYDMKMKILNLIHNNQVVVLSGETGCGKTTQVPQFILDDYIENNRGSECRIICTQPRRISAISVAERVADERAEKLGNSVGYQIRLDAILPRAKGSILYCTTGIVLQWLQSDPHLCNVSHLILDEIHERDTLSDFLICIAKDLVRVRPDLKVVLMSATLNADQFSSYFNNCHIINIPGYTFPVQEFYLEDVLSLTNFSFPSKSKYRNYYKASKKRKEDGKTDEWTDYIEPYLRQLEVERTYPSSVIGELYKECSEEMNLELILSLLRHIASCPPGAVLVFVPGWEQISNLHKMVQNDQMLSSSRFLVIPLHSLMPTVNQKEVFNKPPEGVRKIVIATNIAETSITINDIVYVVDCGRIKMKNYDKETNVSTLLPEWVTLANAKQRRGRSGRVQDGVCYHLYTKVREQLLDAYQLPEIKRTHLAEVILQVKNLRLGSCKTFLTKVMDPPEVEVIDASIQMLEAINALDSEENLTPLGFHLARLPMDPLTGKMILMGAIFSCLSPILTVAASISFKDPFVMVLGKEKLVDRVRLGFARDTKSDHLMLANVFQEWQKSGSYGYEFARNNFLSAGILTQLGNMRTQFLNNLRDLKFVNATNSESPEINRNSNNFKVVKAVITAGLYPNVARIVRKRGGRNKGLYRCLNLPNVKRAVMHPKSVNVEEKRFETSWMVFWETVKTSKVFIYDTTLISNYPLLLFGQKLDYDDKEKKISVDKFVKIRCDKNIADVIQKLRGELDELLEYKVCHPGVTNYRQDSKEGRLLSLIVNILSNEKDSENIDIYDADYDDGFNDDD